MQVSYTIYFMIIWAIGFSLAAALFIVDQRIIEHVSRKEGRPYPASWTGFTFDVFWLFRTLSPSWFIEAKEAGYYNIRVVLVIAFVSYLVFATLFAQSGFAPKPPPPIQ